MNISELSFESSESDISDLEIINEFFDHIEEPIPIGRIYRGAKYRGEFEFGLRELPLDEITHQDENYLVGYESDGSKYFKVYNEWYVRTKIIYKDGFTR